MIFITRPLLELQALQTAELEGFIKMPFSDAESVIFNIAAFEVLPRI